MGIKAFQANEQIIKQYDDGNELYIVSFGELTCSRKDTPESEGKFLRNYGPGEVFGELALMYNAPRAASISSLTSGELFTLDRETFNRIVKQATVKKREIYEKFLDKIEIL
jgi:cAMP-dependent protein kinase regulator